MFPFGGIEHLVFGFAATFLSLWVLSSKWHYLRFAGKAAIAATALLITFVSAVGVGLFAFLHVPATPPVLLGLATAGTLGFFGDRLPGVTVQGWTPAWIAGALSFGASVIAQIVFYVILFAMYVIGIKLS